MILTFSTVPLSVTSASNSTLSFDFQLSGDGRVFRRGLRCQGAQTFGFVTFLGGPGPNPDQAQRGQTTVPGTAAMESP